jgi:hypothetical protein
MNNKSSLQYTELTPDDIAIYEDLYIGLLVGSLNEIPKCCTQIYYEHALNELYKARDLFYKTFR